MDFFLKLLLLSFISGVAMVATWNTPMRLIFLLIFVVIGGITALKAYAEFTIE